MFQNCKQFAEQGPKLHAVDTLQEQLKIIALDNVQMLQQLVILVINLCVVLTQMQLQQSPVQSVLVKLFHQMMEPLKKNSEDMIPGSNSTLIPVVRHQQIQFCIHIL